MSPGLIVPEVLLIERTLTLTDDDASIDRTVIADSRGHKLPLYADSRGVVFDSRNIRIRMPAEVSDQETEDEELSADLAMPMVLGGCATFVATVVAVVATIQRRRGAIVATASEDKFDTAETAEVELVQLQIATHIASVQTRSVLV